MADLFKDRAWATHAIVGSASVALSTVLTYPLDTLKVLTQVGSSSNKQLTAQQVLERVRNVSGNSGLYSGINWWMLGRTFGIGARFGIYEILTAYYKDGREDSFVDVSEALLAGMAAGAVESLVISPFELVKLREQVASAARTQAVSSVIQKGTVSPLHAKLLPRYSPDLRALNNTVSLLSTLTTKHPKMVDALKEYPWMMSGSGEPPPVSVVRRPSHIISLEGWGSLWRNLRSGLVRDSMFGGIFFSSWQFIHTAMVAWKGAGMDPPPRSLEEVGPVSPIGLTVAAGFSGSLAAAVSHGFDTSRSRSQCTILPKYVAMERVVSKSKRPGRKFERLTGIHPTDRNLLSKGLCLRIARSGIASFVLVGSYYFAISNLVIE